MTNFTMQARRWLSESMAHGSAFSVGVGQQELAVSAWAVIGALPPTGARLAEADRRHRATQREAFLSAYLGSLESPVLLIEDMLLRRGDRAEGRVIYSNGIALREVETRTAAPAVIEATSWMLNAVVIAAPTGVPSGADLDGEACRAIYRSIRGALIGAFDGEAYIGYELSMAESTDVAAAEMHIELSGTTVER